MSALIAAGLVTLASARAIARRRLAAMLVDHTHRRVRCHAERYLRALATIRALQSRGSTDDSYGNAAAESFIHSKSKPFTAKIL